ncbi:kinase-like domain-containing protein [Fimicolochytrium jonesii]|uniref:kinase-like domain-containing protein n=1 Tax=Fimicolochytrium jonesii TaxID=1396493 RepID=UPI0022FE94D0|nr:kinase-like domain-containing protein [Fimicolochytrium jonesii]KAI8823343.1 kinase-like domain-containing protein [Fimicolochytrium jonesii]
MAIPWEELTHFEDISTGSFGIVRKADYLGTDVAVKEFLDISNQPGFDVQKYIGREVDILSSVHHPNVLQYMGISLHERKLYLVTELITGGHLKSWIEASANKVGVDPAWKLRISFAIDTARALVYLHAHRIIHRDLKSENLLLTENLRLKICDFGLSREVATTKEERGRLSFCGTDAYMAPEIILGQAFDERVDVFSYGIILCELITLSSDASQSFRRETPYFGIDAASIVAAPNCPGDFLEIARTCTDADPEKRPRLKDVLTRLRRLEAEVVAERPGNIGAFMESEAGRGASVATSAAGEARIAGSDGSLTDGSPDSLAPPSSSSSPTTSHDALPSPSPSQSAQSIAARIASQPPSSIHQGSPSSATMRRLGHYVPHRFSVVSRPTMAKCEVCAKRIGITKKHLQCDGMVHPLWMVVGGGECGRNTDFCGLGRLRHIIP